MQSISFAILSDLHLETPSSRPSYSEFSFEKKSPHLALLGDIGLVYDERLFAFLDDQLLKFEAIFYVLGNHEPYDSDFETCKRRLQEYEKHVTVRRQNNVRTGNFIFMHQRRYDLNQTITVLGCTLFSNIDATQASTIQLFVSDFERIQGWNIESHNVSHKSDLTWLNHQVTEIECNEPERSIVILTHYSPTLEAKANDPRHLKDDSNVRTAFMTDLSNEPCWNSPAVGLWAFGHTHFNCDFRESQTGKRIVANQKGYRRSEVHDFNPQKVVTLEFGQHDLRIGNEAEEVAVESSKSHSQPIRRRTRLERLARFFK